MAVEPVRSPVTNTLDNEDDSRASGSTAGDNPNVGDTKVELVGLGAFNMGAPEKSNNKSTVVNKGLEPVLDDTDPTSELNTREVALNVDGIVEEGICVVMPVTVLVVLLSCGM